jgi:Mg2+ and Co2+ transporter CorA
MSGLIESRDRSRPLVDRIFNDDVMIGLAAVLAFIVIIQEFHQFSSGMDAIFDYVNYLVIAAFVAEYIIKLYIDESRISYISDPIHILDLFIIIVSIISLFDLSQVPFVTPEISRYIAASPALRLIRAPLRAVLVFALAGSIKASLPQVQDDLQNAPASLKISMLDADGRLASDAYEPSARTAKDITPIWIDLQNVSENDLPSIESIIEVPQSELKKRLIDGSFPRIDYYSRDAPAIKYIPTIFLWDSKIRGAGPGAGHKISPEKGLLIVYKDKMIITLCTGQNDLMKRFSRKKDIPENLRDAKYTVQILYSILRMKMDDYDAIIQHNEKKTAAFEDIPTDETAPRFLNETFRFKKDIQKISGNLWHFHQLIHKLLQDKNLNILGIRDYRQDFEALNEEAQYMCRIAHNTKENLISLIDLHINTVSYDMNRVMKVIAVITCLAIIPSIVGGLLGINLVSEEGIPEGFHLFISEVVFMISTMMLIGMYAFYKMKWIR